MKISLLGCAIIGLCTLTGTAAEFHVAVKGDDANKGDRAAPFATLARARDAIRARKAEGGLPPGGCTVQIHGGTYPFAEALQLGPEDSGSQDSPIVYQALPGEKVVFDGGRPIRLSSWKLVEATEDLERLNPAARGKVLAAVVEDEGLAGVLANPAARLTLGGRMMQLARFPNLGFCHVDRILDEGAIYMHGRSVGAPPDYSMEKPVGARFTLVETPTGNWAAEFKRVQKATISGFLAFDWHREQHRIASISNGAIGLLEYSRYGLNNEEKIPRRLIVRILLCELDQPGEWYFDEGERRFYLWPFEGADPQSQLGFWSAPRFAELRNTAHLTIRNLTVEGTGGGMVAIEGGADNLIAGCTFRNSAATAVILNGGERNGLAGCDLYDVDAHLSMEGGEVRTLRAAGHYARNNHFTQVEAGDLPGGIRIRGMGQFFQNNLVHNFLGQPVSLGGNDHVIERNEAFNLGIEEGDGGAFYANAEMWSYGTVFRHNFLHHLMCVPQAHPRGGIYPDDLNGGDTIVGNIFYKAAHRAVLMNGGAGHTVTHNLFVRGHYGVYNTEVWARKIIAAKPKFDSGELKRGDKDDHLWRIERIVGQDGWNNSPWKERYPLFAKVMNQGDRRYYPIENTVAHNLFAQNAQNTAFRFTWEEKSLVSMDGIDYIRTGDNREIALDAFVDPASLDFRFRDGQRPASFPAIPCEEIGLVRDAYRDKFPDKAAYRSAIRSHWEQRKSYDPEAVYDPRTINELLYFNTGRLILGSE